MDALSLALGLVAGAAVGAFVAFATSVAARRRAESAAAAAGARAGAAEDTSRALREELAGERGKREAAERDRVAAQVAREHAERQEKELRAFVETSRQQLEHTFRALSNTALEQSAKQFLQLAEQRQKTESAEAAGVLESRKKEIEALVAPIRESLGKLDVSTKSLESKRETAYASIRELIEGVGERARELGDKASALETTLRGSSQARGRWGEVALRNIVERAGMTEHCDFEEQQVADDGSRPDMTIHLPGDRRIAIDAKAPLSAYLEATEAKDDATRSLALDRHAAAMLAHVRALSSRNYGEKLEGGVDFVVMFLPGDPFLGAAFHARPELLDDAMRAKVLIATPVTLIALLKTVALCWQQQQLAENAKEIAETAGDLYARVAIFGGHIVKLGAQLQAAVEAYNSAAGSFQGRVIPMARRLEELGAGDATKKQVPDLPAIDTAVRSIAPRT